MVGKWWSLPWKAVPLRAVSMAARSSGAARSPPFSVDIGGDTHAEVDSHGGAGKTADGEKVDAGFGVFAYIFKAEVVGDFEQNVRHVGADLLDGKGDVARTHFHKKEDVGTRCRGCFRLPQVGHFDLDFLAGFAARHGFADGGVETSGEGEVALLEHNAVLQVDAMVLAAAAADGVFVEQTQAGHGLSGIEHAGAGACRFGDEFARKSGDAAHALQQVQDDALAGKDRGRIVADHGNGLAFAHADAVKDLRVADDLEATARFLPGAGAHGVEGVEDCGDRAEAGNGAVLPDENSGGGAQVGVYGEGRRDIAGGFVLGQGSFQNRGDFSAFPIHAVDDLCGTDASCACHAHPTGNWWGTATRTLGPADWEMPWFRFGWRKR